MNLLCMVVTISCGGVDEPETGASGSAVPNTAAVVEIHAFTIPAPPGAIRVPLYTDEQLFIDYPVDDYARIVAFYDEWTAVQGQTFRRVEGPDAEPGTMWTNDALDISIVVGLSEDAAGEIIGVVLSAFDQ